MGLVHLVVALSSQERSVEVQPVLFQSASMRMGGKTGGYAGLKRNTSCTKYPFLTKVYPANCKRLSWEFVSIYLLSDSVR
jgi:hypothetical protein